MRQDSLSRIDRRALAAVAVQFFVNGALPASFVPRLPEIRDQVDISIAGIGLLISIAGLTGVIGSAVVGPAVARLGTRRVMLGSGVVISVSLAVIGVAETPAVLLIGFMGMMAFDVMVDVPMNMQASWISARRHTPVMNRLHGLWSMGTLVGGVTSTAIAAVGVSLTTHLIAAAIVLLSVLWFVGSNLLRTDEFHERSADSGTAKRRMSPVLILFALAGLFGLTLEYTASDWAAFRLVDDFGASPGFAGLGYIAATGGMTVGRLAGDWALVRVGTYRLLLTAVGLTGFGLVIATLTPNRYLTLLGYLIAGLGTATLLPRLYDDAAKLPGMPGAGLGALTAGIRLGTLAIPVAVGALAASALSVGSAIAIVTLPSVLAFLAVVLALRGIAGVFGDS
ncbi:MAG: MFS transporter [Acidimicrobiia bacterium]|nr:MFS transporter [Acidimicrobiia bacterium]